MLSARRAHLLLCTSAILLSAVRAGASDCVWKVTAPDGKTLYLGGSVHALRSVDYPLPAAFNRAFDAATRLAFEVDPKTSTAGSDFTKSGQYPTGDSLKNHVDPRTYDYVRRVLAIMKVPEAKFAQLRPWLLVVLLQSPSLQGYSDELGVESFLYKRALANSKPVTGLESEREHANVFAGLNDRQSEALLLITFIPRAGGNETNENILARGEGVMRPCSPEPPALRIRIFLLSASES